MPAESVHTAADKQNAEQLRAMLRSRNYAPDEIVLWMREFWEDADQRKKERRSKINRSSYIFPERIVGLPPTPSESSKRKKQKTEEEIERQKAQQRERARWHRIKDKYELDREQYYDMIDGQHNRCLICRTNFGRAKPCIDHCHRTGRVRGILCSSCNGIIGMAGEDPDILLAAIRYLDNTRI